MTKKVLILTADAGFGHRSAANALASALAIQDEMQLEVRIENLLDDPATPTLLRNTQTNYDKIVKEMPKFYEFSYESSDKPLPTQIAQTGLSAMLYKPLTTLMNEFEPDIIVNTYPLYHGPFQTWYFINEESWKNDEKNRLLLKPAKSKEPTSPIKHKGFITIITDLVSVHSMWMSMLPDYYCVATDEMRDMTAKAGIEWNKILCTGIPVKPEFALEKRTKAEIRAQLGWISDKTTIVAIGSKRVSNLMGHLNVINHSGFDIQLAAIAGGDTDLYQEMLHTQWHIPTKVYNFTSELPTMMMASDIVLSKAGGLITSETLAAGLPMILVDVLPGQEEGNAVYVEENYAGKVIDQPLTVLTTLCHWLGDGQRGLKEVTANAKRIGKPRSSLDIAALVVKMLREQA